MPSPSKTMNINSGTGREQKTDSFFDVEKFYGRDILKYINIPSIDAVTPFDYKVSGNSSEDNTDGGSVSDVVRGLWHGFGFFAGNNGNKNMRRIEFK